MQAKMRFVTLSTKQADGFPLSLSPSRVQHFSLHPRVGKAGEPVSGSQPSSILLVEDNPADAGLVREALEEHGIEGELTVLLDGEQAINFMNELDAGPGSCPDLIIVDLNLPRKPGRAVLKYIRQSHKCSRAPVAILTSSDAERDKSDAARLGASRYIRKPLRLEEFLSLGSVFKEMLGEPAQ
jgi:chemotaxis family two-component system response regulator Rcp1